MKVETDRREIPEDVKRIKGTMIKPVWETNGWDGPLSGVCLYNDRPFYFDAVTVKADGNRRFLLYPLSDETFQALEEQREDFKRLVGEYCEYNADWSRTAGPVKETNRDFYGKYPEGSQTFNPKSNPAQFYFYIPSKKK